MMFRLFIQIWRNDIHAIRISIGIEGMPRLLDCSENPMPEFKKKVYAEAFQKKFQQNVPTFDAIEEGYKTVIDKEQFLINMATALAEHATAKVNKCRRRGDRKRF